MIKDENAGGKSRKVMGGKILWIANRSSQN